MLRRSTFDFSLWLRLRWIGFACGLAMSVAVPLALGRLLVAPQAACLAHWAYLIGELVALLATLTAYVQRHPGTMMAHTGSTIAWSVLVGSSCHLWVALWTGGATPLPHMM